LVLPPILLYRLDVVVRSSAGATFTSHAHAYARALASELDLGNVLQSPGRTVAFLDAAVEGGGCQYATIWYDGRLIGSSLAPTPHNVRLRGTDSTLQSSGDMTYAIASDFHHADRDGTLYLGFDSKPTLTQIREARVQIIAALLVYALASIAASLALARMISRPLTDLQRASRRVTEDPSRQIDTTSSMSEIRDLTRDLEAMRRNLAGVAAQLRLEMQQREAEQAERQQLEQRLRHEQRLATVGTFAGGLAHEFNNILLPLLLYSEQALDDIDATHPARHNVQQILAAAKRASGIVSKMLAFSRPITQLNQPFDPAVAVQETLELFRALVPPNVTVQTRIERFEARVFGDSTHFSQVLLNLMSNAVFAMGERGGVLAVALAAVDEGTERRVMLKVTDTGKGMGAEMIERIFEPFFTTREVGQGTGLGLSVVHGIVSSMGATIAVASQLGKGSEFTIIFPAHKP
jgi:signal transduction histidine kinase